MVPNENSEASANMADPHSVSDTAMFDPSPSCTGVAKKHIGDKVKLTVSNALTHTHSYIVSAGGGDAVVKHCRA